MDLALAVRLVHVVAAVVLVGGAATLALGSDTDEAHVLARRFEWAGWVALGILIATGVGNLAAFDVLPGPGSTWGLAFTLKLVAVLLLATVAVLRTARLLLPPGASSGVRRGYTASAALGLVGIALAQVMAHG